MSTTVNLTISPPTRFPTLTGIPFSARYAQPGGRAAAVAGLHLLIGLAATLQSVGAAFEVEGKWPAFRRGPANAVAVSGTYAYVTGPGFHVFDVADPTTPRRVGGTDIGGEGSGVAIAGQYAYVAGDANGLTVIDISQPATPQILTNVAGAYANAVAVDGHHAYVADEYRALQVFDVSDPANPRRVSSYATPQPAVGVSVAGRYAYVAVYQNPVVILDISDPAQPQRVASVRVAGEPWRIAVAGDYAYVSGFGTGLQVVDVSNPAAPRVAGSASFSGWSRGVVVTGTLAHVVSFPWDRGDTYRVFDVSNPARPRLVGGYRTDGAAIGLAVTGPFTCVAGEAGLDLIDGSAPATLRRTGGFDLNGDSRDVALKGNYAYLADGIAGLQVLDLSVPASPQRVARFAAAGPAADVAIRENIACVAEDSGLEVLDISDPARPHLIGSLDVAGYPRTLAFLGNFVCVLADHLEIIDLSDPTKPTRAGSYSTDGSAGNLAVSGGYVFLGKWDAGWEVVDGRNPAKPIRVASQTNHFVTSLAAGGPHLYVAGEEGLKIWNVSNPAQPVAVGGYLSSLRPLQVMVDGQYAYLTANSELWQEMLVLDVSDPTRPTLVWTSGVGRGWGGGPFPAALVSGGELLVAAQGGFGVSIRRLPGPLTILGGPTYQRAPFGANTEVSVAAFGDSPVHFAWYAGASGDTSHPLPDATGPSLELPPVWEPATYWVRLSNASGQLDSQSVVVRPAVELQALDHGSWPGFPRDAAWDVAIAGPYAYVADGTGLRVVEVSDPFQPSQVGSLPIAGSAGVLSVAGRYAYVTTDAGTLRLIDVGDPASPIEVGSYATNGTVFHRVAVDGTRVYAASDEGLLLLDLSEPARPKLLGRYANHGGAHDVALTAEHVLALTDGELHVIDFRDPANPQRVGRYPETEDGRCAAGSRVLVSAGQALLSVGGCGWLGPFVPRLDILDLREPEHPQRVGSIETGATLAAISGNYAFLIAGGTEVEVIDFSEPAAPVRIATIAGASGVSDVAADGKILFVASAETGLSTVELVPKLLLAPPLPQAGSLTLRWTGGPGIKLQQAATLPNPVWLDVAGTDGQGRVQLPPHDASSFFRAIQR